MTNQWSVTNDQIKGKNLASHPEFLYSKCGLVVMASQICKFGEKIDEVLFESVTHLWPKILNYYYILKGKKCE